MSPIPVFLKWLPPRLCQRWRPDFGPFANATKRPSRVRGCLDVGPAAHHCCLQPLAKALLPPMGVQTTAVEFAVSTPWRLRAWAVCQWNQQPHHQQQEARVGATGRMTHPGPRQHGNARSKLSEALSTPATALGYGHGRLAPVAVLQVVVVRLVELPQPKHQASAQLLALG